MNSKTRKDGQQRLQKHSMRTCRQVKTQPANVLVSKARQSKRKNKPELKDKCPEKSHTGRKQTEWEKWENEEDPERREESKKSGDLAYRIKIHLSPPISPFLFLPLSLSLAFPNSSERL